jgi:hypothetical protein
MEPRSGRFLRVLRSIAGMLARTTASAKCRSRLGELERWIHRYLRCYLWSNGVDEAYRELKRWGVSMDLAWNTAKLAYGLWRLSQSPALTIALPAGYS